MVCIYILHSQYYIIELLLLQKMCKNLPQIHLVELQRKYKKEIKNTIAYLAFVLYHVKQHHEQHLFPFPKLFCHHQANQMKKVFLLED